MITGIFIVITLFGRFLQGQSSSLLEYNEGVSLKGPGGFTKKILYESIESIELLEDIDPGTPDGGDENGRCRYGIWKNDVFSTYTIAAHKAGKKTIAVMCEDGVTVLNAESDAATEALFEALKQKTGRQAPAE